ncbi:MAG: hypothetical protein FJ279_11115 [Planctomycetes bacterium]|nr:hypothetical protein [Planctomycetota bacterium]
MVPQPPVSVLASIRNPYEVRPLRRERLVRVCEALTTRVDPGLRDDYNAPDALPAWRDKGLWRELDNLALPMLARVQHDVALPYLIQLARLYGHPEAFAGIRRVGTKKAREMLESLAQSRNEKLSKLAQQELAIWDRGEMPRVPGAH